MDDRITVEVQLYARLRELCGDRPSVETRIPAGSSAEQCFEQLCGRFEALASYRETLAVAVNDEYASWEQALQDGDIVAFIPPVSGGSGTGAARACAPRPSPRRRAAEGTER